MSPMRPRKVYPGQAIRAQQHNALRSALPRESPLHIGAQAYQRPDWFIARVMDEGPAAEADYTDERYWVQEHYCWNAVGDMHDRISFRPVGAQGVRYVTATNLGEIGLPGGRRHTLPSKYISEFYVQVFSVIDRQHPGNIHYFFMGGGCPDVIPADGICYICSWQPDTNYGGHQRSFAYLDTDNFEMRMLLHWAKMPATPEALIIFAYGLIEWATDATGLVCVDLYEIATDFDPCTVTWNTRPAINGFMGRWPIFEGPITDGDHLSVVEHVPRGWYAGISITTDWSRPYDENYGIEVRMVLRSAHNAWLVTRSNRAPLLLMPGITPCLECETTEPAPTTPAPITTTGPTTTPGPTTMPGPTTTGTTGTTEAPPPTTPPVLTTSPAPTTSGPTPTTGPTTTTEAPTTTTVAETMSHECCDPNAAPVRWGFIVAGLGEGCEPLNVSGVLKWTGTVWAWWDGVLHGARASLECHCIEGSPFWEFQIWKGDEVWCGWISWEDHTPDCGINCDTGGTFTEDCLATGPTCCEDGGATVWPKFP